LGLRVGVFIEDVLWVHVASGIIFGVWVIVLLNERD
jgi:hypothetical protein